MYVPSLAASFYSIKKLPESFMARFQRKRSAETTDYALRRLVQLLMEPVDTSTTV